MENLYTSTINVVRSGEYINKPINYKGIFRDKYHPDDLIIEISPQTIESYTVIDVTPVFWADIFRQSKLEYSVEYLIKIFWKDGKKSIIYINREVYLSFITRMNDPKYES